MIQSFPGSPPRLTGFPSPPRLAPAPLAKAALTLASPAGRRLPSHEEARPKASKTPARANKRLHTLPPANGQAREAGLLRAARKPGARDGERRRRRQVGRGVARGGGGVA